MFSRNSHRAFVFLAAAAALFLLTFADAASQRAKRGAILQANAQMVSQFNLTDLCLFTEARYTRHPSQADLHTPFQDQPLALEHFPSGSLIPPPRTLVDFYETLDRKAKGAD